LNITILGAGAIGSLWGHHLNNAGHNISFWARDPKCSEFKLSLDFQKPNQFITNSAIQLKKADLLIVTVKAWQLKNAITPLLKHLSSDTIILFMHNGMGAVDELSADINIHPIILATTTHGAYKSSEHVVTHTGSGTTTLGAYNHLGHRCHFLTDVLENALPRVYWSESINEALWKKLAINCIINPLTALNQCLNGELMQPRFSSTIKQLINEISAVMKAEGIEISVEHLLDTVHEVIIATAKNFSSMQQDIAHQRKTEIDYITGYLCNKARKHQIDISTNQNLYNQIKNTERLWS